MMADWLRTDDAADLLDTSPSNLAQFSHRLRHVCVKVPRGNRSVRRGYIVVWPEDTIRQAALARAEHGLSVPKAIEFVAPPPA